jgi:tetratricopeptide (TPR) repeat protein
MIHRRMSALLTGMLCLFAQPALALERVMVLPFDSPKDTSVLAALGPGTMDSLITALLRVPDLVVVDRATLAPVLREQALSASGLVDEGTAVRLGKLLGAQGLITGQVQVIGEQVRLSAKLIDTSTGQVRQAEQVTGELKDVFRLQDELTGRFLTGQGVHLSQARAQAVSDVFAATRSLDAYAYYQRGRTSFLQLTTGTADDELSWYDQALKLDPDYALAYAAKAESLAWRAVWAEYNGVDADNLLTAAETCARQALSRRADLPEAHRALAAVAAQRRFYDEPGNASPAEREEADRAVALAPNDAEAYLARWLLDPRDPNHADIRKALELNPRLVLARLNRAWAFAGRQQFDEAVAECQAAIAASPRSVVAHDALGEEYLLQDNLPAAESAFRTAITCDPGSAAPHLNLGQTLLKLGRLDEAVVELRTTLRLSPDHVRGHRYLSKALLRQGATAESVTIARRAIVLSPQSPWTHEQLGEALLAAADPDGATQAFRAALNLKPDYPEAQDGLARALHARKHAD